MTLRSYQMSNCRPSPSGSQRERAVAGIPNPTNLGCSEGDPHMTKSTKRSVGRRGFLKGAAVGAAALAAQPQMGKAQQPAGRGAQTPSGPAVARETGAARPAAGARVIENPGSD